VSGGVFGACLGAILFDHKTNVKQHPSFVAWLSLGLLLHGFLIYLLFLS
jgi:uncharacterized membrane protein YsdA (DUF1294 family)